MHPTTFIDFGPVLSGGVNLAAMLVLAVGAWAIRRLERHLGLSGAQDQLEHLLDSAVEFARAGLIAKLGHADFTRVDTHSAALASAFDFAAQAAPKVLATLGISEATLKAMLTARLARLDPALVAPATTPAAP